MPRKVTTAPEVDEWFATTSHPLLDLMQAVRKAALEADPRVTESIKWKSPTFEYRGNIASINPRAKRFVQLMFHNGALIPGTFEHLEGGEKVARYMNFDSLDAVKTLKGELQAVIRAWCDLKDA